MAAGRPLILLSSCACSLLASASSSSCSDSAMALANSSSSSICCRPEAWAGRRAPLTLPQLWSCGWRCRRQWFLPHESHAHATSSRARHPAAAQRCVYARGLTPPGLPLPQPRSRCAHTATSGGSPRALGGTAAPHAGHAGIWTERVAAAAQP